MKSRRQTGGACAVAVDGNTSSGGGGCKMERKDVEKNRRLHMKGLCLKLSSLVPPTSTHHIRHYPSNSNSNSSSPASTNKDAITQLDQLDSAAEYIKQLKGRIDALRRRKERGGAATVPGCSSSSSAENNNNNNKASTATTALPVIEVRHRESTLDVALVSEAGKPFKLHEVVAALEREGAEVVSASFSLVADKIFYTLHSQPLCPRIGLDAGRVTHRLHALAANAAACYTA